jgi:nucleoside-diphosphate-sugar epimerase
MPTLVIGGGGFIGSRVLRLLLDRGESVVSMDINPNAPTIADLADRAKLVRGDVTQFDDMISVMLREQPERVLNLSYYLGSEHAPRTALKLNIVGMDNCFEAARLTGVKHVVYASSLAVNGQQKHFGDRPVTEDDFRHGDYQYAVHKIFNEWQAKDYRDKYGMSITGVRPANVTGPNKVRGSVDHVNIITQPARGKPINFPYRDAMRCPIHVDDVAEVFARVLLADAPRYPVYNTCGTSISLGEIADIVRGFLPDAQITFEHESGGRDSSGNHLIDNTRLVQEFGVQYLPYRQRVLQIIDEVRRGQELPPVSGND